MVYIVFDQHPIYIYDIFDIELMMTELKQCWQTTAGEVHPSSIGGIVIPIHGFQPY